jgi:hypothetical protein
LRLFAAVLSLAGAGEAATLLPGPGPITCEHSAGAGACRGALDLRALPGDFAAFIRAGSDDLFAARVGEQGYSCVARKGFLKKLWEVALSNSSIAFQIRWTGDQTVSPGRNGAATGAECTDLVLANWPHDRVSLDGLIAALRAVNSAEAAYYAAAVRYGSEAELVEGGFFEEPAGISVDIVLDGDTYTATARLTASPATSCSTGASGQITCS